MGKSSRLRPKKDSRPLFLFCSFHPSFGRASRLGAIFEGMRLILAVMLVVFSLEVAPVTVSGAELGIRPNQSLSNEIQLFGFATDGSNLVLVREFMALQWTRFDSNLAELNPPKLIMGQTYFSEGRMPAGDIQRDSVYWRSVEYAYGRCCNRRERSRRWERLRSTAL
jgi:hypothetical protein